MSVRSIFEGGNVKSIPNVDAAPVNNVLAVVSSGVTGVNKLQWMDVADVTGDSVELTINLLQPGSATSPAAAIPARLVRMGLIKYVYLDFSTIYDNPVQNTTSVYVNEFVTIPVNYPSAEYAAVIQESYTIGTIGYICYQGNTAGVNGTTAYGTASVVFNDVEGTGFFISIVLNPSMNGVSQGLLNTDTTFSCAPDKYITFSSVRSDLLATPGISTQSSKCLFTYY